MAEKKEILGNVKLEELRLQTAINSTKEMSSKFKFSAILTSKPSKEVEEEARRFCDARHDIFGAIDKKIENISYDDMFKLRMGLEQYCGCLRRIINVIRRKDSFKRQDFLWDGWLIDFLDLPQNQSTKNGTIAENNNPDSQKVMENGEKTIKRDDSNTTSFKVFGIEFSGPTWLAIIVLIVIAFVLTIIYLPQINKVLFRKDMPTNIPYDEQPIDPSKVTDE